MGVLWKLEPATAAKHRLYQHYLDAWWPVMLQPSPRTGKQWSRITYLDAFAGPGRYENGEDGSPIFTLERLLNHVAIDRMALSPDRVCLVFTERDRQRCAHLRSELLSRFGPLEKLPVRVEVHNADASDSVRLLTQLQAWRNPVLAVFDSWGNVGVPLTAVTRIARNPSSEVITTFGPNWFSRRSGMEPEQLDSVFGGRQHWVTADLKGEPEERWRTWLAVYRDALHRAGFAHRLQFQVVPRTGQPLYLVFGTGHRKGIEAMKTAMWKVDDADGMSFKDPRTRGAPLPGQVSLFAGHVQAELLELVDQRLKEGPVTVESLGEWLLLETAQWRPQDASRALKQMHEDQRLLVYPSGRLTKASQVRLIS